VRVWPPSGGHKRSVRFREFKIDNYKGFLSSATIRLERGLNVIVGPNNVGKTALIEALSLRFGDNPHRSLTTKPTRTTGLGAPAVASAAIQVDSSELYRYVQEVGGSFWLYARPINTPASQISEIVEPLRRDPVVVFTYSQGQIHGARFAHEPAEGATDNHFVELRGDVGGSVALASQNYVRMSPDSRLSHRLANAFRDRIYLFRAERLNVGEAGIAPTPTLEPNASNLAAVLHLLLSSNPTRFQRFQSYVRDIFPQIQQITVPPIGGAARIFLWPIDPQSERDDLTISLAESGTGIGQVMAILYVLLTSEQPRVILIDEPHSFLHPSAIRKLLDILIAHPQHQYVITTHSPTALVTAQPKALLAVRMHGTESTIDQIDPTSTIDLRAVLADIGARLSDVFGADSILWVEGQTEELCFPIIRTRSRVPQDHATGTVILAVRQTGDFVARGAQSAIDIYRRLSGSQALLPPAIGFIFDPESRSEPDKEDLRRRSEGRVHFLKRRMFENYLLNSEALAAVIANIAGFRDQPVSANEIAAWINTHRWERRYFETVLETSARSDALWFERGNGALLLADLFKGLSQQRVTYDKVRHGVLLTEWLCENAFEHLAEVAATIREAIGQHT
jgi:AAA domain, putative AbiEii toxin, Type IV TA system/AAA domain